MKALGVIVLMFFGGMLAIKAQNSSFTGGEVVTTSSITFLNTLDDYSYQFNLVRFNKTQFAFAINVRVEDELTSEETYKLFKEVSFFDVNLNYTFNAFELNMSIENTLGFKNNNFAIEPNLEEGIGKAQNILFTHEADFLVSASIAYNF